MGRLFIAEKPELARAIAKGLIGNESKGNKAIGQGVGKAYEKYKTFRGGYVAP
mgnify:FL=1|jgi:DNA topoisomerase